MIPKIIHYCWFGGNPLPKAVLRCIESWKKYCPDYQIILWNEENFNINSHPFMKAAYENKKWAFVSDYARLKIIYENGGIYLDTDVELLKPLDMLLENPCYVGVDQSYCCATGLGFGAERNNPVIGNMLKIYDTIEFDRNNLLSIACPKLNTSEIYKQGYCRTDSIWQNEFVTVYPPRYFDPLAPGNARNLLCADTVSIHNYTATWESAKIRRRRAVHLFFGEKRILQLKEIIRKKS